MINILLNGCNGRMGRVITRLAKEDNTLTIAAGVDITPDKYENDYPVYNRISEVDCKVDVVIDFSNPEGLKDLLTFGIEKKVPLVICTTGLSSLDRENIKTASSNVAILNSANMSLGINLILNLVKTAARALEDSFDIEIIEKHHNQKVDSPSGTALAIADSINDALEDKKEYIYGRHSKVEKRTKKEIGIHAVRGGNIAGEHTVIFAGAGEVIEISHNALSRDVFGIGALKAAKFLYNREAGLYNMNDVIDNR